MCQKKVTKTTKLSIKTLNKLQLTESAEKFSMLMKTKESQRIVEESRTSGMFLLSPTPLK